MKRPLSPQVRTEQFPRGWVVAPDQDGSWRIRPRRGSNLTVGLLLVAAGLGCCGFAGLLFAVLSRGGGWKSLRLTMLLPLGLLLVGRGLWLAFGHEEWRTGADVLEVRWSLLGVRRVRRFRAAALRLTAASGSGTRTQRRLLRAARAGGRAEGPAPDWAQLWVSDRHGMRCLASCSRDAVRPAELRSLGELLSEHTGWPLLFPARG